MRTRLIAAAVVTAAAMTMGASQLVLAQPLPLVNEGGINPKSWVYGPRNNDTTGGVVWNPVKQKMINGEMVVGRTVSTSSDAFYCTQASQSNADFTWTEMQHSGLTWGDAWRMWAYGSSSSCPTRRAMAGARVAYTNEREIQHALDGGAMVLVVPTVDTEEEAKEVVQWAYFPPMGRRSQGGSQTGAVIGQVPGGYRNTFNNNLVLIVMIETIDGVKNVEKIARVPGIDGVMVASTDLRNFSGYAIGDADYEKLVTAIHDAVIGAGKRLCGPLAFQDRPDFTCFQQ